MKKLTFRGCMVAVALSVGAMGVQAAGQAGTMGKMDKPMETSYTGCVEAGSTAGSFVLTHAATSDMMGKDMMAKEAMPKDDMKKDAMKSKGMAGSNDAMKSTDTMEPKEMTLGLSSKSVDLSKHVGHKVTVTGTAGEMMHDMKTFTVSKLQMIAGSCM